MLKRKRAALVIDPEDLTSSGSESDSVQGDTSDEAFRSHGDDAASDASSRDPFSQEPRRRKCDNIDVSRDVDGRAKADSVVRFQETGGQSNVVVRFDVDSNDRTINDGAVSANNVTEPIEPINEQERPVLAVQSAGGEDAMSPQAEMDDFDAIAADIPCDTLAAIHFLRASFPPSLSKVTLSPHHSPRCLLPPITLQGDSFPPSLSEVASSLPPFALLSQIYTVVPHRTTVDRQLEMLQRNMPVWLIRLMSFQINPAVLAQNRPMLQRSGSVRVIRLMSSRTDIAVLLSQDYDQVVEGAKQQFLRRMACNVGDLPLLARKGAACSSKDDSSGHGTKSSNRQENSRRKCGRIGTESSQVAVFDWFKDRVLPQCTEHGISRQQLERLLSNAGKSCVADRHICILVQAGLLVAQVAHIDSYWFSLPNIGSFTQHLTKGRSEVIGLLQRSRFGEMLKSKLEVRKKHKAAIPDSFILRDLMGQGRITKVDSTVGEVLRLCNWTRK
ncbi:unnamed protein product [Closterium sp. NIES-53]